MPLDDITIYDRDGNKRPLSDALKEGISYGMTLHGHGLIDILLDGTVHRVAFRAPDKENFLEVTRAAAEILFKEKAPSSRNGASPD